MTTDDVSIMCVTLAGYLRAVASVVPARAGDAFRAGADALVELSGDPVELKMVLGGATALADVYAAVTTWLRERHPAAAMALTSTGL